MAESTAFDCFYRFCRAVIAVFGDTYLRSPTVQDTARILSFNEARGFEPNVGKLYEIRRTGTSICKNKVKNSDFRAYSWGSGWKFGAPHA
jgi:hypothetical protein